MEKVLEGKEVLQESRRKFIAFGKLQVTKSNVVFGNSLHNLPKYFPPDDDVDMVNWIACGLPIFLVKCVSKIETMIKTDGLYRINGDVGAVQKLRCQQYFD